MKIKAFRIPSRISLPGIVIQVKQVPTEEIEGSAAQWDYDVSTGQALIRIAENLPIGNKRYALYHELNHVWVDLIDVALECFPKTVSTVHMTKQKRLRAKS